jgi:hypothetical protein
MLELNVVRGSPTRTEGDRGLAGGLQHRTLAQLAKVSDAGRVRRTCVRATAVAPLRRSLPALGEAESGKITCLLEVFPYGVADCREHTRASL